MVLFGSCGGDVWAALVFGLQQALLFGAKWVGFFETDFDFFFHYYSCVWQNIVERLLQSACSPCLEGAVSASERPHRGHGWWPYKSGVVLTSVRRVTGQFSIISGAGEVTKPL